MSKSSQKKTNTKKGQPLDLKEPELIMRWIEKKIEVSNGLTISFNPDNRTQIRFELEDEDSNSEGYYELLQAKIYDTFGIADVNVASVIFTNCVNSIISFRANPLAPSNEEKLQAYVERCFSDIMSLFREFRPQDPFEAMMISKLIILDSMSTREFIAANSTDDINIKTSYQNRGVKLTRLWCEIKDKLDKHRKPNQQIIVQHNHIHNEGQAIIGSNLNSNPGGGK